MTQRAAKPDAPASAPGAFLPDGCWNERGELHHRGDTDRLVRSLVRERRLARLTPQEASLAVQAGSAVLAFPNWRQWETAEHWAVAWTGTSAEEAVKRAGETCATEHHWCGGGKWLPGPQGTCPDPLHRAKGDAAAVREMVAGIAGKAPSLPAGGITEAPEAPPTAPDESWPAWVEEGYQP